MAVPGARLRGHGDAVTCPSLRKKALAQTPDPKPHVPLRLEPQALNLQARMQRPSHALYRRPSKPVRTGAVAVSVGAVFVVQVLRDTIVVSVVVVGKVFGMIAGSLAQTPNPDGCKS